MFPTLLEKGTRLGYGLVANHPFIDGNKRIGVFIMLIFFEINGIIIELTNDDVIDLGLGLASGKIKYDELLNLIRNKI